MSTLRTNALEGMDAKNSITIVTGAGNVTTTNVQKGICKYWGAGAADGASIEDSFNISSLVDNNTGVQHWYYTNTMNSTNYVAFNASTAGGSYADTIWNEKLTTYQNVGFHDDSAYRDNRSNVGGFGDLA